MNKEWLTTAEASELSGYHPYYLRELMRQGRVIGKKFGTVWQISKDSLLEYVKEAEDSGDNRRVQGFYIFKEEAIRASLRPWQAGRCNGV